jgi:ABC-type sugar transport system substrate-binding protein
MFNTINNNIIKTLGIDTLPEEQQKEAMEKMGAIVYQEVMLRVLDIMTEEDKDAFEKLLENNPDPEAMFAFLGSKVPNIEAIVAEEAEKFRTESAEIMSQIGN